VKILVTGGAGYIGNHLVRALTAAGSECFVLDNLSRGLECRIPPSANFEQLDLSDRTSLAGFLKHKQFDVVYHLAGFMQARESTKIPEKYWENNVMATRNLLELLPENTKSKFVFSSSCSVYGNSKSASETSLTNPLSVYAKTKVTCEEDLKAHFKDRHDHLTIFRFFNIVGNDGMPYSCDIQRETLLPANARRILNNQKPVIFGDAFSTIDGYSYRDYIDVRDLTQALLLPLTNEIYGTHNLTSSYSTSTKQVIEKLLQVSDSLHLGFEIRDPNPEDPSIVSASLSRTIEKTGWTPHYSIDDSIRSFWTNFSSYFDKYERRL